MTDSGGLAPPGTQAPGATAECHDDVCITCSDVAVPVTVMELLDDDLAIARTPAGPEEISVALVTVAVGDTVLVHAGEAIAVMPK
ncbi:MAG TPA: HypC/HybG/HupF family hydrogenase formation chaperone [Streptosporangiaceae bacterium]|nr:HypC/HybG/HupF family hydrogenase formation chaperone [Streptosporangiaceae bacterium]